jgi:hypothetical protein
VDVLGDFQSRIILKKPAQARQMLKSLLPVFEQHGKLLIFRTWTVGVSKLGALLRPRPTRPARQTPHLPRLRPATGHGHRLGF